MPQDPESGATHPAPTMAPRAQPERPEPTRAEPVRLLLVDDDRVDRMAVLRGLRSGGIEAEAVEVDSCQKAREQVKQQSFDCVFLDFLLPDGNGLDLVHELRQEGLRVPIVILTGQGDEQVAVELMKAGASDYLPKAHATPERITQCLRNALRLYRAERQVALAEKERARLYVLERLARDEAEAAQRRLAFLAEASALVSSSLDYETTLQNVTRLSVPSLASWCFLDLLEVDGGFTRVAVAHSDPQKADLAKRFRRRFAPMADAPHGVSRVIASGRSEIMTQTPDWVLMSLARDSEHLEMLRELAPGSTMRVPLVARGRTLGAMTFITTSQETSYTMDDLAFAEEIARRAALAVDNSRLYHEVKAAEERLSLQLDFTTAITDGLAEGVCALDEEGRFTFLNPAAESILGYQADELLGKPLHAMVHRIDAQGESREADGCALFNAVRSGRVFRNDDDVFRRKDGTLVPVSYVVSPISPDGRAAGAVLAFHDVTERKRSEAQLEESRRHLALSEKLSALGTLVSGVAHELRTPLTYLTNNIFLLQTRLQAAARENAQLKPVVEDAQRFGDAAMEGVDRINALVKDLRPFANPEAGRKLDASLDSVVAGAVDLFRATQRGRIEVEADLKPTPKLQLDRGQIQRVVINLLVNAAEAMPKGGRLRIRTATSEDGGAVLEVEDEGEGIPPEIQSRMFDPFFTTKGEGTGLGLSITRRIVEAHGGTIRYRSTPGKGTAFTIHIRPGAQGDGQQGTTWDLLTHRG